MMLAKKVKSQFETNLQKVLNHLKTENRFVNYLKHDFGLCLIKNDWLRDPI